MKEKAKDLLHKTKERLKKISKKMWIAIAAVLVALVVVAAIVLTLNKRDYAVLVTDVSNTEASNILNYLSTQGVTNYQVKDGNTILVPAGQESALKAGILMQNLNQTGNYYYFENLSSFSTNEERAVAQRLDLQADMAAVLRNFPNVVDATVNITPGEDRSYILDSNNIVSASAGVILTMRESTLLTDEQAESMRNFVAHSVQGLEIESVSISDMNGNIYLSGELNGDASAQKLLLQQTYENRIRTNVKQVLDPFFGEDNVRVGVSCEIDVGRTTEQRTEIYLPEYAQNGETGGRGPLSSERYEYYAGRPDENIVGGLVGSEVNSDLQENVEDLADPENGDSVAAGSGQRDYENSRSEMTIDNNGAVQVTDCHVAVSINARTAGDFSVDNIRRLVARAAGISGEVDEITGEEDLESKIEVVSMDFYSTESDVDGRGDDSGRTVSLWVLIAAGVGLLLFIILLTVILLLRSKRKKQEEAQQEQEQNDVEALLAAAGLGGQEEVQTGADVMSIEMERSMELRKEIRQFATDNPEIAAQMIKTWLKGGDENA